MKPNLAMIFLLVMASSVDIYLNTAIIKKINPSPNSGSKINPRRKSGSIDQILTFAWYSTFSPELMTESMYDDDISFSSS